MKKEEKKRREEKWRGAREVKRSLYRFFMAPISYRTQVIN
jgi:hypothetical protein